MDQRARNYIARVAELVLKEFELQIPITDIDEVVSRLGGCICSKDDALVDSTIARVEGAQAAFVITVSACQPSARRTFAIAQEIGHLFLHMGYLSDPALWATFSNEVAQMNHTEKEFQANEFASNFLMPQKEYLDFVAAVSSDQQIDAYTIAEYFHVSESRAAIRGKLIGALKWS